MFLFSLFLIGCTLILGIESQICDLIPTEEDKLLLDKALTEKPGCDKNIKNIRLLHKNSLSRDLELLTPYTRVGPRVCLVFHGWIGSPFIETQKTLTDALVQSRTCDVIAADFTAFARCNHNDSIQRIEEVGEFLAYRLCRLSNIDETHIDMIGFSFGAHLAGAVARSLYRLSRCKVHEIIALAPAGLGFDRGDRERYRLRKSDAEHVVGLYFAKGTLTAGFRVGHQNVLVGCDGRSQRGCENTTLPIGCAQFCAPIFLSDIVVGRQSSVATCCNSWEDFNAGFCQRNAKIRVGIHGTPYPHGDYFVDDYICPAYNFPLEELE